MIKIIKHKKITKIKQKWETLILKCEDVVPTMHYDFLSIFTSDLVSKIRFLFKKAPTYIEVVDNDETVLILPCIEGDKEIISLDTLDYFDCIFNSNISSEIFFDYLKQISKTEGKKIVLNRLKDDGATYKKLSKMVELEPFNECVKINFNNNYEEYYSSLSKSARQNLRTAYNRANTDGLKFEFNIDFGKASKQLQKSLNKIYINRRISRYKNMSLIKKLVFGFSDKIANVCFGLDNSFYAYLTLNKKPVAFMAGLKNGDELIVPRLAINDKYSRYSLGVVLVNETIKAIQEKGFTCLDLSTGTETYKFQMGGVSHISYSITIGDKDE